MIRDVNWVPLYYEYSQIMTVSFSSCSTTVVVPSTISDAYVYYLTGPTRISWVDFTDTVSQSMGSGFCGVFSYTWVKDGLSPISDLTWTTISSTSYDLAWTSGSSTDFTLSTPYPTSINVYLNSVFKMTATINIYFMCTVTSVSRNVNMVTSVTYLMDGSVMSINLPTYSIYPCS